VIRRLTNLVLCALALWAVAGGAAYYLQGRDPSVLVYSGTAGLLCLLPGLATVAWASWAERRGPDQGALAGLGGTGVRLFFVAGAGMVLRGNVPYFQQGDYWAFWGWVLVFYLFLQAAELTLLLGGRRQPEPAATTSRAETAPAEAGASTKPM
jgi:hypothetical protein